MALALRRIRLKLKRLISEILEKPIVSVVVPVYNGEKKIMKCLNGLLDQTLRGVRVIIVDDGSTDNTWRLLCRLKIKNPWIKVIHQENKGRGTARNRGLQAVKTKYVMFCDADDWYENDMCEKMVDAIVQNDADISICGVRIEYEAHEEMEESDKDYYKLYFDGLQRINDEIIIKTDGSVCNKIFRMDIIKEKSISFLKTIETAEDYYFYSTYMSVSKKAYYLDEKLYNYVRHADSIMSKNFDGNTMSDDDIKMAENLYKFYKRNGFLKGHIDLFWRQWVGSFWASYRYSGKKINPETGLRVERFIMDNYEKYEPEDIVIREDINDIKKILRKTKKGEKHGTKSKK